MNKAVRKEVEALIKDLDCSVEEFREEANWYRISIYQKLSEDFIREFKNKVDWRFISLYQKLSEDFIREFQDKVDWCYISINQKLSEDFIKRFSNRINTELQTRKHKEKSDEQKLKEIKRYAKKHDLKFNRSYLYAFRDHDMFGRGSFNKTIFYEKGKKYRDWHCDMDENETNSFGLGIWPEGNTPVRVHYKDWGVEVNENNGKGRVWGFEVLG